MEINFPLLIASIAGFIAAYLLGSINFAIIITRLFKKGDIREQGSGNAGMTNVLRTVGKVPALLTLIGDFSKGIISIIIMRLIFHFALGRDGDMIADYIAAYGALLGHSFPVYYGFRGGKGILVSFGAILMLSPISAVIILIAFIITVSISKYVSLGSVIAAAVFPFSTAAARLILKMPLSLCEFLLALPISILVIYLHRSNIARLLSHTENKLSFKKKS